MLRRHRRSPRRSRSGSRGRDDSPRPSELDEITVKVAPQLPATAVQQALWAAAAKAQPGAVSPAEAAHRQREPPKPSADGALHRAATTLWLTWHYELLQIRAANPAPPAFPYLNREILHASALPVGTPLPRGLRTGVERAAKPLPGSSLCSSRTHLAQSPLLSLIFAPPLRKRPHPACSAATALPGYSTAAPKHTRTTPYKEVSPSS